MGNTYRKNVIIVGAGASKEFGLPTGFELKNKIAEICDIRFDDLSSKLESGDPKFVETLRTLAKTKEQIDGNISPYLHEAWRIRDNMAIAPSIDNFLDTHSENSHLVEVGKLAIAHSIISAENESKLFTRENDQLASFDFSQVTDTWLGQLFTILSAQRKTHDFIEALKHITFISFNYDRCIHQYFAFASRSYFSLDDTRVQEVIEAINIIYPYGSVGEYQWHQGGRTDFGKVVFGQELIDKSKRLKTFTEGTVSTIPKEIFEAFSAAEVVMFMGFGFLKLNMDMLFEENEFEVQKVIATGKGLSENSRHEVGLDLNRRFKRKFFNSGASDLSQNQFHLLDKTCSKLIFEFQRFLSA